jgi:tRNA(Arg) A34 adenosine deaminase TadA
MCYSTAFWARISKVYYAAAWEDYDDIFSDLEINQDLRKELKEQKLKPECLLREEAQRVWDEFRKMPDGARY